MAVETNPPQQRIFEVVNSLGLHARAAALLVQTAQRFRSEIEVCKDDLAVNGKSIMGVLMLAAGKGSLLTVRATGEDAAEALEEIGRLIRNGFWEKE